MVDDVTTVSASDLDITKEDGRIVISVEYARKGQAVRQREPAHRFQCVHR